MLVFCCAPLFTRLGGLEQRNDEAIYSYSVDRILETGHWLTPRRIPDDGVFLEKPPLKFWMVAGLMKVGVIPQNDWGMRFPDAVMCAIAFVYVYLLAARFGGAVAGFVSVFLLVSFEPLLFQHGIRGNNMEGSLLLSYCGGVFHFVRWLETGDARRRRQIWFFCGYFFLGFMTKFVAAIFLPLVCVAGLAVRPAIRNGERPAWRDWLAPAAATAALIAPWFIYQTIRDAREFWQTILMSHVVTRFTGVLIPSHLHSRYFYFTQLWYELQRSDCLPPVLVGSAALLWAAVWQGGSASRRFLARLMLIWWIVPEVLISAGTSKLFYYSYPFLPPLAIGAGLAFSQVLDWFTSGVLALLRRLPLSGFKADVIARWQARRLSDAFTVVGTLCLLLAAATWYWDSVQWHVGGVRVFKNSSIWRPFVAGAIAWYFAGLGASVVPVLGASLLTVLMPFAAYERQLGRLDQIDGPLRAARDCALSVQASRNLPRIGVYKMSGDTDHPYYYYLWRLGTFLWPEHAGSGELGRRLEVPGEQSLVVLSVEDYVYLGGTLPVSDPVTNMDTGITSGVSDNARAAHLEHGLPPGVAISKDVVVLFPGEYASCARVAAHAGPRTRKLAAVPVR